MTLAEAAVRITRQVDLSRALHEIAAQTRALLEATRATAEVSRAWIGHPALRVESVAAQDGVPPQDPVRVDMRDEDGSVIGHIEVWPATDLTEVQRLTLEDLAAIGSVAVSNARLRAAERRTRSHAARLQELTSALSEAVTVEEVAEAVVQHLQEALDAEAAVVARCTEDNLNIEVIDVAGLPDQDRMQWRRIPASSDLPLAEAARTGNVIFAESREAWLRRYPNLREIVENSNHHAMAALPLIVQNRTIGSIGVAFSEPRQFDPEDRALAISIARQCAFALDRARLYESEQAARLRAEVANATKSEFLAVISHELRTPLNAISGYTELMLIGIHGPLTDAQREDLDRIQRSQRHLLALINNLLDYAKLESGRALVAHDEVNVQDALQFVIQLVTPQMRAKEQIGQFSVPDGLCVVGDREKLQQILLNLLANAIKFTPRQGTLGVNVIAKDGRAELTIWDNGIGVPADMRERIFEPFVQLESTLTSHTTGTGLGLAISRDLARLMDGSLRMDEHEAGGACFVLSLPLARHGSA